MWENDPYMSTTGTPDEAPASEQSARPRTGPRILILFSDIGEGHASAARTLRDEILTEDPRAEVLLQNGFEALGRFLCWFMRDYYRSQSSSLPWTYRLSYTLFRKVWLFRKLGELILMLLGGQGVRLLLAGLSPDLVISTDARLNVVLGNLKKAGKLKIPVFATLTDLGGLEFWVHRGHRPPSGHGLHLHGPGGAAGGQGGGVPRAPSGGACLLLALAPRGSAVRAGADHGRKDRPHLRRGLGVGDLEGAVLAVLGVPGTHAVCVAGRNADVKERLQEVFSGETRLTVLGFTSRMNELLAACDVVVHAMGGVTYLEATVRGRPVIAYRPPSGHPAIIAATLQKQGRQRVAETREQLSVALQEAFAGPAEPGCSHAALPSPASAIFSAPRRVRPAAGLANGSAARCPPPRPRSLWPGASPSSPTPATQCSPRPCTCAPRIRWHSRPPFSW